MPLSKMLTRNDLQNVLAHINLGDDAHKEITQAEFDALTDEEKDDGTIYFITDGISKNIFLDDNTPVGAIMPYGGDSDPAYWLICDGRAVSRTAYAELFAVIGTTYGTGDGSTTFNIPDLRGRVAVGHNTTYGLGASGGEATHTLSVNEMPSHDGHLYNNAYYSSDNVTAGEDTYYLPNSAVNKYSNTRPFIIRNANEMAIRGFNKGGGAAHNNMQPYLVTNYIIKTSSAAQKEQSNIDLFYPVGARFETSDSTFNPSIRWGGVWEREDDYELVAWISVANNAVVASKNLSATGLGETGVYTLTFEKPMANTDYIVTVSGEASGIGCEIFGIYGRTTTQFLFDHANNAGTAIAVPIFTISVFGRLAEPDNYKWHRIA